jgi:hypothetical protein
MSKFFSFFVLVLFLVLVSSNSGYPAIINMPLDSFNCDCYWGGCSCKLGEIEITAQTPNYESCYRKHTADPRICIIDYAEVIHVKLPFLKFETLEESHKRATTLLKKELTFSEKASYFMNSLFGKTGLGTESDKFMQILKEKLAEASKSESEKASVDFTTYFVIELAKDASLQKRPKIHAILLTVKQLASLASEGKLTDFLTFYFYLKDKYPEVFVSSSIPDDEKFPYPIFMLYGVKGKNAGEILLSLASISLLYETIISSKDTRSYISMLGLGETISDLKARLAKYLSNDEKFGKAKGVLFIRDLEKFGNLTSIQEETEAGNKEHLSNREHFNFVVLFFVALLFVLFSVVFLYLMRKKKKGGVSNA